MYKIDIIKSIPNDKKIKIYFQGEWFDLCDGPHIFSTGQIGNAFKLIKISGAYWRGNPNNTMLSRIYGTAFFSKNELDNYLNFIKESEKRDHRYIGKKMNLFFFQEDNAGLIFWQPNGWKLFQNLLKYMKRRINDNGYLEVNTPQILDQNLWKISGHLDWYKDHMFHISINDDKKIENRLFSLKPMNCPGHIQIFKNSLKSYRDLPIRIAEFGTVHRYEPSGALHGLMRARAFTQDDGHIFCTTEQLFDECINLNQLIISVYKDFGFNNISINLSTRPKKRIGSNNIWDNAENTIEKVLQIIKKLYPNININILDGEGAFYGPKIEYILKDVIGRDWQCGTIQIDFNLPKQFKIFYIDKYSKKCQPVMVHRAIFGSMERFIGIFIENFSGKIPLWLSFNHIVIATITSDAINYAQENKKKLQKEGFQVKIDIRNEKINYKIREHCLKKVPIILVCGKKEVENKTFNIRCIWPTKSSEITIEEFINNFKQEIIPPDLRNNNK